LAFDQSKIGNLAAQLMESLENSYSDDAEIGDVLLILEITSPSEGSEVVCHATDTRKHVNLGLIDVTRGIIEG
jgi:hypothetical protein